MVPVKQILIPDNFELPSLPQIYFQIQEAINDPTVSIESISNIISKDSGLSASVLRFANSALYGTSQQIDTMTRALVRIGTQEINTIVLGATITTLFEGIPEEIINMRQFWKHSISCGIMAKGIATYLDIGGVERYFIAGLLHDLGKLVLYKNMTEMSKGILLDCRTSKKLHHFAEQEKLGFDHTQVAKILLEKWHIPDSIKIMIVNHHKPAATDQRSRDTSVLHLADVIVNGLQLGTSGSYFVPVLSQKAWDKTGLSPAMIPPIVNHAEAIIQDTVASIIS